MMCTSPVRQQVMRDLICAGVARRAVTTATERRVTEEDTPL